MHEIMEVISETSLDVDWLANDITVGANAYTELQNNAGNTWEKWVLVIVGLRGLRELAFANIGVREMRANAYRVEMRRLLSKHDCAVYQAINAPTRSACYKMMTNLDDICEWYETLDDDEKLWWNHPQTIATHCPQHLLTTTTKLTKPIKDNPKKPKRTSAEYERLRRIAMRAIEELMPFKPDVAVTLLYELNTNPSLLASYNERMNKNAAILMAGLESDAFNDEVNDIFDSVGEVCATDQARKMDLAVCEARKLKPMPAGESEMHVSSV
jgi:hypothetical protein